MVFEKQASTPSPWQISFLTFHPRGSDKSTLKYKQMSLPNILSISSEHKAHRHFSNRILLLEPLSAPCHPIARQFSLEQLRYVGLECDLQINNHLQDTWRFQTRAALAVKTGILFKHRDILQSPVGRGCALQLLSSVQSREKQSRSPYPEKPGL